MFLVVGLLAGRASERPVAAKPAAATTSSRPASATPPRARAAAKPAVRTPEAPRPDAKASPSTHRDRVTRVIDGDTVVLAGLGSTRLIGVDTPEVFGHEECFGQAASTYTKTLLRAGTAVRYRFDAERQDRYGRALAYLFVGDRFVNGELAKRGYAVPMTIPPNVRYADKFLELSRSARRDHRGLWAASTCAGNADKPVVKHEQAKRPASTSSPAPSLTGDRDCPNFSSQHEAQDYFEAKGGPQSDPDRLDADHDGMACDSLG
jgi:micrococcal nuclease